MTRLLFVVTVAALVSGPSFARDKPLQPPGFGISDLRSLIDVPGVSGFEGPVRNRLELGVKPLHPRVDEAGNLIVTIGRGKPHVLVCANMDEDGYFVSDITDDGYLRLHRVTSGVTNRLFDQMHYGQPIVVITQDGSRVPAVVAASSVHLQRGRDQAAAPKGLDDMWVDVGAGSRAEVAKLGIQVLDSISLRDRAEQLAGNRVAGEAAQARAADVALQMLVASIGNDAAQVTGTLTVAWTAQGSFGDRGMARLAQEIDADRVISVVRTQMPRDGNNPRGSTGQLGAGPIVAETDAKAIEAAKRLGLNVQPIADALRAPAAWPAAKTQVVGLPGLYAQTRVEVVDSRDVESLVTLLRALTPISGKPANLGVVYGVGPGLEGYAGLANRLSPLISAPAVSGAEGPVRDIVVKQLPKWAKPEIDQRGNVTVTAGQGGKEMLFVAHMDEVGYEIVEVRDDGTATVRKRGGFFDYLWEAHPVLVQTSKGPVPAIVAPRAGYLNATAAAPGAEDVVLYCGTASRAETQALGVAKGDTATIRKHLAKLAGSRYTARSMDDRCGVAALLAVLNRIDAAKMPNRITFAFVVGEETGLSGSGFLAERSHPPLVFAIDTFVSSDSPVDPHRLALVPLGSAVVSRAIDNTSITPTDTIRRIIAVGRAHNIPVVASATSGGNDGSQFSKYGSVVAPLSWPGRYSHSPVEVMDLRDLENLVNLIAAIAAEF